MTTTATRTSTRTFVQTATHLAGTVTASLTELLLHLGIDPQQVRAIASYETAFAAWIGEQTLGAVIVEIHDRRGVHQQSLEFEIEYLTWDGTARFADGLAHIRRQWGKLDRLPIDCTFSVTARARRGRSLSDQPGWCDRTTPLAATTASHRLGTVGRGPGAKATLRSLT